MFARWSLGLLLSLLAHLGVVVIGLAMGARGFTGPVHVRPDCGTPPQKLAKAATAPATVRRSARAFPIRACDCMLA